MIRTTYLDLAAAGARLPIGADMVLREQPDPEAVLTDGIRLGAVIEQAARRYRTPLALPLMDLTIEKAELLATQGVDPQSAAGYHYAAAPGGEAIERAASGMSATALTRHAANLGAVRYIAQNTDLTPCGLVIGPFSLMTKLVADPIAAIYMAGLGLTGKDDPEVLLVEQALELAQMAVERSLADQIAAGARLIVIAEPAVNSVYLSPKQLKMGSDILERFFTRPMKRLRAMLREADVDLFLHDCGELVDPILQALVAMEPHILSLGSSRLLWEDAAKVPDHIVLYGNLPTKRFYADDLTEAMVADQSREIVRRIHDTGHPHILGSECDVLSVPGKHAAISGKVTAFMECDCR
ncbi:MAG: hypothetical protein NT029_18555 [Armatimonadetes bacterium]|nr:hypothetical protein [Armatimonadota bacterium]